MRTGGPVFALVAMLSGAAVADPGDRATAATAEPQPTTMKFLGFTFCFAEAGQASRCPAKPRRPRDDNEIIVPNADAVSLQDVVTRLRADGVGDATVVVVDGELLPPGSPLPPDWRDARVRTAEGSVTLARRSGDMAVVVFGRPSSSLRAMQHRVARAVGGTLSRASGASAM